MKTLKTTFVVVLWTVFYSIGFAQPNAEFTANVTSGCGSLQVSFTDQSTGNNITGYSWDLGGVTSTTTNPGRIFGSPGNYEICLTVTDANGDSDTACKPDYITVFHLPQPEFSLPNPNGCVPFNTTFTDLTTSSDGNIEEWIWGLGGQVGVIIDDGSLPAIENVYDIIDDFTVSLTVKDDNGCVNTITKENYVSVHADPEISFTADQPFSCSSPHTVNFINTSPNQNMTFQWDFGNGQIFNGASPQPAIYTNQGLFNVSLRATDNVTGCTDTLTIIDYIQISYPVVFNYSADSVCVGGSISFTDLSPDPADDVYWDFGDGTNSTEANPIHTYDSVGCFYAIFTRNVGGCPGVAVTERCIEVLELPQVSISNDNPRGCIAPHTVNFSATVANGSHFNWNFGDGNQSTDPSPTHTYQSSGVFPVTLTLSTDFGCQEIAYDTIKVVPIKAIIATDKQKGCTPLTFELTESSQTFSNITAWKWTITNDSSSPPITFSSVDETPSFTLVDTGYYDVKLSVIDQLGCQDSTTAEKRVAVGMPPVVSFSALPTVSCINTIVNFTDESSDFANGWFWEFGDGGTSEDQHPFYEYSDTGHFDIKLVALHHDCPAETTLFEYLEVVPPKAGYDVVRACDALYIINFDDRSIGADSLFYDFGVPGITADTTSERNPTFNYPTTGDYFVSQIAFNFTTGCSDTLLTLVQITEPNAVFGLSAQQGCTPLSVQLSDTSNFAIAWEWTGGGIGIINNANAKDPIIRFDQPGAYTDIQLLVTDVNGCQDSIMFTDTIYADQITPEFTAMPTEGCFPLTTNFIDLSTNIYGEINGWTWNYGDGTTPDTQPNPAHTFSGHGFFDVSLTATNTWGCSATITKDSLAEVTRPVANFTTIDTLSCRSHAVSFANQSQGKEITYSWDFGDGELSTDESPIHQYGLEGIYTVCLTVVDKFGCDSTLCRQNYIVIADPHAGISQDTSFGICPPLLVNFENTSVNATSYEWDFGDQSGSSNQENPPHIYTMPGTYSVSLIAIATESCKDTLVLDDLIQLHGPSGQFHFDIDTACAPAAITFVGSSPAAYDFIWDYGDGVLDTAQQTTYDSISYIYQEGGDFIPKLILVDNNSCQTTLVADNPIVVSKMQIDFQADRTLFCNDQGGNHFINLTASTHPINAVEWTFEGGLPAQSSASEPDVEYFTPGAFPVKLTVDNGICLDSMTITDYIGVGAIPEVGFLRSDSVGCAPLTINFTDTSLVENSIIDQWQWNFGDQTDANIERPVHIFTETGNYEVELIATSAVGCQDTVTQQIEVLVVPEFTITEVSSICKGQFASLYPSFSEDTTGYVFQWINHPDLSCTNCLTPEVNPLDTTSYHLAVTNTLGCSTTESVSVPVRPYAAPVVTISPDTTICLNDLVQLRVSGGDNLHEYQWDDSRAGLTCYDACINPVAQPLISTNYVVTVTNEYGCATTDSVAVSISNTWEPIIGDDRTICAGDSVHFNTAVGNYPAWLETNGLSCTYCPDPVAYADSTTTYRVRVLTNDGCELLDTVTITVAHPEDISAGADQQICNGETILVNGTGTGTVTWMPNIAVNNPNAFNTEMNPTTSTTYQMLVQQGECTLVDSMEIIVQAKTALETEDIEICAGDTVTLGFAGAADQVFWFELDDLLPTDSTISPEETTTYQLIGQLSTCAPDSALVTVNVTIAPTAFINEISTYIPGHEIKLPLIVADTAQYIYEWTGLPAGLCDDCQQPVIRPDSSTASLSVQFTDLETGCSATKSIQLVALNSCPEDLVNVPNAFSPNDDGNNDLLRMYPNQSVESIRSFRVFNRWGALLYETDDLYDSGWDGNFGGKKSPIGVYIYMVEFECELNGKIMVHSGDVTLVR